MSDEPGKRKASSGLARIATWVSDKAGSSSAFALAVGVILIWALTGPIFHYADTWQLVINTGTTIVTFLMVFLIQRTQNKSALAVQLKLNEIVAALDGASNRLISVEDLSEEDLNVLYGTISGSPRWQSRTAASRSRIPSMRPRRGTPRNCTAAGRLADRV